MSESFQSILVLLDEGVSLYRRHFVAFILIAASWFVPVAILAGLLIAASDWLTEGMIVALALGAFVLLFPLLIYLLGGLSRAAVAAADGRPVRFRESLAIHPLRAAGMGCFSVIYYIIAQMASSILSLSCICPLYFFGLMGVGLLAPAAEDSTTAALGLAMFGILLAGVYLFALIVGGATYSSLIYGIQPWVQESLSFGESLQRSLELTTYRFGRNLVAWGLAALLVAAVGVTVMLTIGLIAPLPLFYLLGEESPVAQAVAASAWLIGLVVVLPPLPIWMALLYRRNAAARAGADLDARIQAWLARNAPP